MGVRQLHQNFDAVFRALKPLFSRYESRLDVAADEPGKYYLKSKTPVFRGKPMWFGGVEIKKNYVSFHLVAMYVFPELAAKLSPELKKRKQGKGCFNFSSSRSKTVCGIGAPDGSGNREISRRETGKSGSRGRLQLKPIS